MAEAHDDPRASLRALRAAKDGIDAEREHVLDDIADAIAAARRRRPPVKWGDIAADLGLSSPQAAQGLAQRRAARAARRERNHPMTQSPREIAQAHQAGAIDRAALIGALIAYPYERDPHQVPDTGDDGFHPAAPGSAGAELGALADEGLLDAEAYDAILHGIAAART
jgi:hypothetical protein